jgi:hypothetical protein
VRQHEIEEQPPAARIGGTADHAAIVELAPGDRLRRHQRLGRNADALGGQRLRNAPPVGKQQDAARIQKNGLEGHV